MFTNRGIGEVVDYFNKFERKEFAHSGQIAPVTIILEPSTNIFDKLGGTIEPYLR